MSITASSSVSIAVNSSVYLRYNSRADSILAVMQDMEEGNEKKELNKHAKYLLEVSNNLYAAYRAGNTNVTIDLETLQAANDAAAECYKKLKEGAGQ